MKRMTFTFLMVLLAASLGWAQDKPLLLQRPALSQTHIAFSFAGDLWTVPRAGGEAIRLTTGVGFESIPLFSPDGKTIAFTGQYDGNTDVYVVPVTGGVPQRLTWHPGADSAVAWTPDGKNILFKSGRASYSGFARFFTIPANGGVETEVALPMADDGAYSPDGSKLAYTPLAPAFAGTAMWKNYRGGRATKIWLANLSDSSVVEIPRTTANDFNPIWSSEKPEKVFFLSDRNGRFTLFDYDTKTKKVTQLIKNDGIDIKSASAGPGAIIFDQFGEIKLYDLKTGQTNKVNITLNGDLPSVRPRYERVAGRIASVALSPTGARAVFEARGEIISVPAEKGNARNLTNTPGAAERYPAWSPNGKWIAYFSDESGEYALHLREQSGIGEVKKISLGEPPSYFYSPEWSPDSKKIAFTDKRLNLWYVDIEKGTPVKVDTNTYENPFRVTDPNWAPDSKWITYTKQLKNHLCAVFVHSLETGKSTQITDGLSDARFANFDKNGKYLYFTASTNLGPAISFADLSGIAHQSTRSVYVAVLRNDIPSPLAPESDEEKVTEEKKAEEKPAEKKDDAKPADKPEEKKAEAAKPPAKKEPEPLRIDLEGIDQRIIALPIPGRSYTGLVAGKANLLFILEQPVSATMPGQTVHKYDLEKRKLDKALDGILSFQLSANGEKALYRQGFTNWWIGNVATLGMPPMPGGPGPLKTGEMEVFVDPKVEWKQMFNEAWRSERDFFYDKGLHGLNLEEMKKRYAPYVDVIAHRSDLNYLFTEMLNQLTVGHMFINGGDVPRPNFVPGGLLGADYKVENGRYRFAKVYNGENWNPQLRAPLTQPGVNVKVGEYLLAVNGRNLAATDNLYQAFESKSGKQVVIKVGPNADGSGSRDVTVVPVASENGLRNLDWIESNRRKVDQLSGGKLAYIYMPNTSSGGYDSFTRYFFSQTNKNGALIDERFNSGGLLADYVVQVLSRQQLSMIHYREGGQDVPVPAGAIYGPKAMLINEMAGSGGDAMPWYFRKMKLGPTVGKRTWGGLIASFGAPTLMDGGSHTAPDAAIYGLNGEWEVENAGVPADIEVEFDPAAWRQGRDPQLEKAVEYLLDELKKNPPAQYKRPAFPNYHKPAAAGSGN